MTRSRQIKMDRGDTLGGTTPLIVMGKELGTPFVTGENRRRRRRDKGGSKAFWQLLLAMIVLAMVAAVLGLGYERFMQLFENSGQTVNGAPVVTPSETPPLALPIPAEPAQVDAVPLETVPEETDRVEPAPTGPTPGALEGN
ncbi:hypothetical protein [Aestuariispira insulae]|uniref:Uncharacterized protein n=1 Tax=Aestuariispira insulae TaxID=1461337 RepID=A0A3D9HSG3_9PROT|nr:hypothetical protein [Aestuariispira insulae]RED52281.1 hypothetical protein DFP90_102299 [Aestuariispira insulae]